MGSKKAQEIIDGMQSFDKKTRLKYMKELKVLCEILGMERTQNEIIEFLYNIIEDDSDVLFELSNNLIFITNFLNNVNNCNFLCDLLLHFIVAYEREINSNAIIAFKNYIQKCDSNTLINIIYPKIIKLVNSNSDNYRIGVSRIIPIIIERCIQEDQPKYTKMFVQLFLELCQDQSVLVKKSCCETFSFFLFILKRYKELIQKCKYISTKGEVEEDEKRSLLGDDVVGTDHGYVPRTSGDSEVDRKVKSLNGDKKELKQRELEKREEVNCAMAVHRIIGNGTSRHKTNDEETREVKDIEETWDASTTNEKGKIFIDNMWEVAMEIYRGFFFPINGMDEVQISAVSMLSGVLTCDPYFVKNLEEILRNICNDESWRVRATLANNIYSILKVRKNEDISIIILLLLKDVDSNVRSIVLNNLDNILVHSKINVNIMDEIFDDLKRDIDSNNVHLKISLCKLLCSLPDILDKNGSIEYILPLFLLFIRIEESDLKSELFICLHKISKLISFFDMKQIIIPLCQEIVKSKNWRLRHSLYYYLKFFGHFFFYQNKENVSSNYADFWNYINIGAKDVVYSIRMEVVDTLNFLIKDRNFSFFEKGITRILNDLKESRSYICRITCLQYISKLVMYFSLYYIENYVLNILEELSMDKISNIRYNIVMTIYYVKKYVKYVLSVIMSKTYDTLMCKVTRMVERKNKENEENEKNRTYERSGTITSSAGTRIHTDAGLESNGNVEKEDSMKDNMHYYESSKSRNDSSEYFHILNYKQCLLNDHIKQKKYSFLINSCSISSFSFYENMKNTDTNKRSCENILNVLSEKINTLGNDTDTDVSMASNSLKNDDFFYYINSINTFNAVCRPIK
ncbi:protein phosphatase PP2A regulatory subunit A [Plasmodium gonderi]|uniref:Protein phosphatase PP2A regulatory subunit A n=1 Tax=Plasmodium gonderi TaxID=77519 RepID=A0A1Y1JU22_PLAGO|nr:protein phosphatase PP2A regulatory subunit A [Plasmodium gonderi]GAW83404.1 protein phosphatase PP2A regulatory subunit A [Plasmodium gonderi]